MKINSLLYRTKVVLESDDDMFPGVSSSAFDEHIAHKKVDPNYNKIWKQTNRAIHLKNLAALQQPKLSELIISSYEHEPKNTPTEKNLIDMPWIDKYPLTADSLYNTRVETDGLKGERVEHLVSSYESALEKEKRYLIQIKRLKRKLAKIRKKENGAEENENK